MQVFCEHTLGRGTRAWLDGVLVTYAQAQYLMEHRPCVIGHVWSSPQGPRYILDRVEVTEAELRRLADGASPFELLFCPGPLMIVAKTEE